MHSHRQARSGYSDRDVHPMAIRRSIEFVFIVLVPRSDSSDDYPDIEASTCGNSVENDRLILMVALNGDQSCNNSSGYPTIGRSETSNARTPSVGLVQNLNSDFNAIRVQAIMENIQCMAPDGSPLLFWLNKGLKW
jgi:hypothetical protein